MSAMLMAMFLCGMSDRETVALTEAMLHSGEVMTARRHRGPKSTSIRPVAWETRSRFASRPWWGVRVFVPMIAGRGLVTPGDAGQARQHSRFRTEMEGDEFERRGS